jgi:tol-pal system protein YbgF
MRGALEELQHAQSQAGSQQRAQYLDLDQRLQAAEQALAGLAARTEAARPAPTVDPAAEYQSAFERLKSGDYAAAGSAFEAFLAAHPGHELAPNARYWLGEVGYVERDYALALASFERVLADYPTSRKVPDALLKAAYSLQGLKRPGEARSMLARLAAEYPDTPAGREAATRLAQQDDPGR